MTICSMGNASTFDHPEGMSSSDGRERLRAAMRGGGGPASPHRPGRVRAGGRRLGSGLARDYISAHGPCSGGCDDVGSGGDLVHPAGRRGAQNLTLGTHPESLQWVECETET
jgi:hypothetical protein